MIPPLQVSIYNRYNCFLQLSMMNETKDDIILINATYVHLPIFSPNQPLTWIRRAERHFYLNKFISIAHAYKADYIIDVMPESVF